MVDVENEVYTKVRAALKASTYSTTSMSGVYENVPSSFPFVSITESDNYVSNLDNGGQDYASLMYEINVYTNSSKPKTDAKAILNIIDSTLDNLNFTRLSIATVPNLDDGTIYRMVARYSVDTDGINFYRR